MKYVYTNLALASLTLIRGRARSSFSRWLCSSNLLNLSSVIDCFGPRELIFVGGLRQPADDGLAGDVKAVRDAGRKRVDEMDRGCVSK